LQLTAEREGLRNAGVFVKSLLSPFTTDAVRFPDAFCSTSTAKFIHRLALTRIDDSVTTSDYYGLMLNPCLAGHYAQLTSVAAGTLTWASAVNHPQYAEYAANFYYYRCTGLSVIPHDYGAWLDRGARIYVGLQPYAVAPSNLSDFGENPRTLVVSSTEDSISHAPLEFPWVPYTFGPGTITDGPSVSYPAGLSFRTIQDTAFEDQRIVFIAVQEDSASDEFQVDITTHWEFIPIWTNWALFNPVMAVGTVGDVARIIQELLLLNVSGDEPGRYTWAASARRDVETVLRNITGGGSFFGKIRKTVGNLARGAYNVAQSVVNAGGALASGVMLPHHIEILNCRAAHLRIGAAHLAAIASNDFTKSPWYNPEVARTIISEVRSERHRLLPIPVLRLRNPPPGSPRQLDSPVVVPRSRRT
jgi:hypothetical protein